MRYNILSLALLSSSLTAVFAAQPVYAQNTASGSDNQAEDTAAIVVTGVRGQPRTVQDSPVPVDVIAADELKKVSQSDTLEILKAVVPSYSVTRQPNSTTGTFIRPVTLRGLPEDKTLLLLNSKRRHKSASVAISGNGAHGADASVIPALALKSVEVLRDGAAAQYGSDAIAGVINFMLNDSSEGLNLTTQLGQFYESDGEEFLVAGNIGLPLTDSGFVNVTVQYAQNDRTTRSEQYTSATFDAVEYAAQNPAYAALVDLRKPLQRVGQPKGDSLRAVINSGIDIGDNSEIYFFGNASRSKAWADANYRYPGNGQPVNDTPVRQADGSIFKFDQLFPAGFRPLFKGTVTDLSGTAGYRGSTTLGESDFTYDFSARYGRSKISYFIKDTVNPSIGPDSPREFTPNTYVSDELGLNADFSYSVNTDMFASPLLVSFGGEYRREGFKIKAGDIDSYRAGTYGVRDPYDFCTDDYQLQPGAPTNMGINCANYQAGTGDGFAGIDPVYNVLAVGSNGFTGTPPNIAGDFSTNSKSAYVELSTDIVDGWFVDLAGRYENFSAFGSTVNGKAATKIDITDNVGIRASVGTGFHAPSAGLINQTYTSIRTVDGVFTLAGLFPATNPVSQFLGAKELKPEKSVNFAAGITATPLPGWNITLDGYLIKLRDQFYSTSNITVTPAIRDQMIAAGVVGADSIASVNFFQNAFNSTTKGIDLVSTYTQRWANGNRTSLVGSLNVNRYKIDKKKIENLFDAVDEFNFVHRQPRWRSVLTATHEFGNFTAMIRGNLFGPNKAARRITGSTEFPTQSFHTEALIDAEIGYTFDERYKITVGARNIFDNYPQRDTIGAMTGGAVYRTDSVVDWNGGYYFVRLDFSL